MTEKHVHLIGIGGSGMSAIARLLLERGLTVSGSDQKISGLARRLQADGAQIYEGHSPENIRGADVVVRSSAIPDDNVEAVAALEAGLPLLKRSEYLGHLMEDKKGVAVAGTHGKTTTTAMIAWLLTALNQDPSFIVGGVLNNLSTNARAGEGPTFVVEADEYDHMFLGLRPGIAVVTNVEHDHPDMFPTSEEFFLAFTRFVGRLTPDGSLVACTDDPGARRLLEKARTLGRDTHTYGLEGEVEYLGSGLRPATGGGTIFDFSRGDDLFTRVFLPLPGRHNVLNALAALAVVDLLGLSVIEAAQALRDFKGTGRRFQVRGEADGVTVIDDYAHHPTEIHATLQAASVAYPNQAIWVVWQPHTYIRTRAFFDHFLRAFADADHVIVTDVFSVREQPSSEISADRLVASMDHPDARQANDFDEVIRQLAQEVGPGDIVLVLSAGDADRISIGLLEKLTRREQALSGDAVK